MQRNKSPESKWLISGTLTVPLELPAVQACDGTGAKPENVNKHDLGRFAKKHIPRAHPVLGLATSEKS
jgi:hypothetical protein